MTSRNLSQLLRYFATLVVCGMACPALFAQGPAPDVSAPDAPTPIEASSPLVDTPPKISSEHKFWDNQNRFLFTAVAASSSADFAVTRANLQSGGQELNPVVRIFGRSTPGLALNFAGETAGVVSLSYFFHRMGHHKLERAVSFANIAASAGAVSYGLTHR